MPGGRQPPEPPGGRAVRRPLVSATWTPSSRREPAAERPFSVRDGRAWGPGVCDMKGGLVTMLHAAEAVTQAGFAGDLSVCMAFNSDEEIGSRASRSWFEGLAVNSRRVSSSAMPLDRPAGPAAQGGGRLRGPLPRPRAVPRMKPEKGANAVLELAHQVLAVTGFARPEAGTSDAAFPTTITGGGRQRGAGLCAGGLRCPGRHDLEEARRIESCFRSLTASRAGPTACGWTCGAK